MPDISILEAYLIGNVSPEEEKAVNLWLGQSPENINILESLAGSDQAGAPDIDYLKVKGQLLEKMGHEHEKKAQIHADRPAYRSVTAVHNGRKIGIWLKVAAVVLVMITAGLLTTISESDYTEQITYTEITSPVRTVTDHTLPDGSRVELSANSSLKYSSLFSAENRVVHLEGEAFFDVVPDDEHSFKVYTGELFTTVLGTRFNVNNMHTLGKVEVALVEGSVEVGFVNDSGTADTIVLQPDEWVRYSEGEDQLAVQQGVGSKILWRDGVLEFNESTLEEVAIVLGNWYGVDVEITDSEIRNRKIVGSFKDKSLEHVLETLKFISGIDFKIDKNGRDGRADVFLTVQLE